MIAFLIITVIVFQSSDSKFNNEIQPMQLCGKDKQICQLDVWNIERHQTMVKGSQPVTVQNGQYYAKPKQCGSSDGDDLLTDEDIEEVITVDGTYRYIQTVNKQFPGPSIVVYEGQEVVVTVRNQMPQEGTGIHWHGLLQNKTNFMDGVPGLTQCSINPEESFTYRFLVKLPGTYWYHSHYGLQRTDGLYGAIICLAKEPVTTYAKDFLFMVSDFFPMNANLMLSTLNDDLKSYTYDAYNDSTKCMKNSGKMADGQKAGAWEFYSGLINGKGQRYDENGDAIVEVPLEIYDVEKGNTYKFRIMNMGMNYAFKVSFDEHPITIVATESGPITPIVADSIIVHIAERYEITIETNQNVDNYWIRAETLEEVNPVHKTLAILRYAGAQKADPTSSGKQCSSSDICQVVNCPFRNYNDFGDSYHSHCTNVADLKANNTPHDTQNSNFEEHFLQFGGNAYGNAINDVKFILPPRPPTVFGEDSYDGSCTGKQVCTHQIHLTYGNTVQFVLLAKGTHPIHLHGHDFQVLKVGYPTKDQKGYPDEIECPQNTVPESCKWKDMEDGRNLTGINTLPVVKDSIIIPKDGYVVIRFQANNRGWWFLHCHLDQHLARGMAIIIKTGEDSDMHPLPSNISKCGSFDISEEEFREILDDEGSTSFLIQPGGITENQTGSYIGFIFLGFVLGIITIVVILFIVYLVRANREKRSQKAQPQELEEIPLSKPESETRQSEETRA